MEFLENTTGISYAADSVSVTEMTLPWATDNNNQSASSAPNNCVILDVNSMVPWDNPENLVSYEAWSIFDRIKSANLIPILFFVGIPANLLNLAVFFKQGLQERINLCLFTLALVDIISLTSFFFSYAERMYTQFTTGERRGPLFRYMVNNNVIGLYGFSHASAFLTTVISTERCICVMFPLKALRCMPTKLFAAMVILGVLAISLTCFAVSAMYSVACFYEERTRRLSWQTTVNDYFFKNKAMIDAVNGVFYGFCVRVGFPLIVFVTTVITGVKLTQIVRWRNQTSSSLSTKEIGVTKMLIALSIEFLLLSVPMIIMAFVPPFVPKLTAGGVYTNLLILLLGLFEVCTCTSAAVNFFVYYTTGSKYRETFRCLFSQKASK